MKRIRRMHSLKGLKKEYRSIRKEHGDRAKSSYWLAKNKYQWLYAQVTRTHNLKWNEFKEQAGFNDKPLRRSGLVVGDLIKEYLIILKEHGDEAKSSEWISNNGHEWICHQIRRKLKMSWPNFIKLCEGHFSVDKDDLMI